MSTTEELAALPTPSVPLLALKPLKQLIIPIVKPKTNDRVNVEATSSNRYWQKHSR